MSRRVVITGIGAVTPIGDNAAQTWSAMKEGKNGIAPITAFDASEWKAPLAAEVKLDLSSKLTAAEMRKMDRFTQLAVIAAREAVADSGVTAENSDFARIDTIVSSGIGGMSVTVREYERGSEKGFERISPFYIPMTIANIAAGNIAIEHGFKGDCSCLVTACASSTHAIGEAMRQRGLPDYTVHAGPLIRRENEYRDFSLLDREKIFDCLFHFVRIADILSNPTQGREYHASPIKGGDYPTASDKLAKSRIVICVILSER